jgi:hypothetical protein
VDSPSVDSLSVDSLTVDSLTVDSPTDSYMDSYYTDRFDKYIDDKGIYHVLFSCPRGAVIKKKHRIIGIPPESERRLPCDACLAEIKDWLKSLPGDIRPSQFL